jgi:hypothetical protein
LCDGWKEGKSGREEGRKESYDGQKETGNLSHEEAIKSMTGGRKEGNYNEREGGRKATTEGRKECQKAMPFFDHSMSLNILPISETRAGVCPCRMPPCSKGNAKIARVSKGEFGMKTMSKQHARFGSRNVVSM